MGVLNFTEEVMPANAIKHKVVELTQMTMNQMLEEIYYLLKSKNVVDADLVVLKFTIMDDFEIEQAYSYSKNFEKEFEDRCLRYLIPLYIPCCLRFVIHQKYDYVCVS